ncbi:MAG: phage protease [Candidatus Contendobacter sp.]|nr:phage protease [Candidatus Contendobacter sp.]MDS4031227.1 phage protease [Candidatus Contendobacter sp.]
MPAGPDIVGRDGRAWRLSDPDRLIQAFQQRGMPLCVDWEHASEHRAPAGLESPAAGWVTALELRDGAVWGRAEWTERAAQQISAREYRFLSPVFRYEKQTGEIRELISAALVNSPNLELTALNREENNALRTEFFSNPALVREFGEFSGYAAFRKAESAGRVRLSQPRQPFRQIACNSESDFLKDPALVREFGTFQSLSQFNRAVESGRVR